MKQSNAARYRWVIVAAGFSIWAVAFGVQYSFGIFFKPLQEAFGWTRASTSWIMTLHLIVFGLAMVPIGWAIERYGSRAVFSASAILIGLSLALSGLVSAAWQIYFLYGLPFGIGISTCGPPVMVTVTRWFDRGRGLALGITAAGVGFGTLMAAPIVNELVTARGWRDSFVIVGIATGLLLLVCAWFMKRSPSVPGSPAGGHGSSQRDSSSGARPSPAGLTLRHAFRTRPFLLFTIMTASTGFTLRAVMVHLVPHALDIGISPSVAALVIGALGGASIVGRLVMGVVQDRIGPRPGMMICIGIQGLSMLALPFANGDVGFFVFALVFGFTYGGDVPQVPALAAEVFGTAAMGTVFGALMSVNAIAGALGPIAAGFSFDLTGHYTAAFLASGTLLLIGMGCLWKLRPARH